jgi:hypothetical protein
MSSPRSLLAATLLLLSANAFAPSGRRWVTPVSLRADKVSAADAYTAAEEASKKYGVGSKEAALAWEVVEDVENDGGAIHASSMIEDPAAKSALLEDSLAQLADLTSVAKSVNTQIKSEILKLDGLKIDSMQAAANSVNSPAYLAAKAEAEAATNEFGANSEEAKVAWEAVFEVVSAADDAPVNMGSLEDECLVSTSAKCADYHNAMDELRNAIVMAESTEFNKSI